MTVRAVRPPAPDPVCSAAAPGKVCWPLHQRMLLEEQGWPAAPKCAPLKAVTHSPTAKCALGQILGCFFGEREGELLLYSHMASNQALYRYGLCFIGIFPLKFF